MFVKIVLPYNPSASSAMLYEASQVRFGTAITRTPPQEDHDFSDDLGVGFGMLHRHGINSDPSGFEGADRETTPGIPYWIYRYAIWPDDKGENVVVVTSGDIYLLSNSGKTVERVVS